MVFGWGDAEEAHEEVYERGGGYENPEKHEAKFSHEAIAGGAAFAGFKLFEDQQRREGKVVKHAFAKELLAGFAAAEVDKLAETRGLNEYDKLRAQHEAKENAKKLYDDHYIDKHGAEEYNPNQYSAPSHFRNDD